MENINQLILDCVAKVLRINETTDAQISISVTGHINALECDGYKHGYYKGTKKIINGETYYESDYSPLKDFPCGWIRLNTEDTESQLRALLESLNTLEKELLTKEAK